MSRCARGRFTCNLVLIAVLLLCTSAASAPLLNYRVQARYPHDVNAFTQGLVWSEGELFESTGRYGFSSLRAVDLDTGRVLRERSLPKRLFGEGLTLWGDRLVQLTWREGLGLIHARETFEPLGRFSISGEGWGLTHDGQQWILSDGTSWLAFLDPKSGELIRRVRVTEGERAITRLNELEWIEGAVWANIWLTDHIVRIDPDSGALTGRLDLGALWPRSQRPESADVLNGIAWRADRRHLLVTGKCWPWVFELAIEE